MANITPDPDKQYLTLAGRQIKKLVLQSEPISKEMAIMNTNPPPLQDIVFTLFDRCPSWCDYCYNAKNVSGALESRSFKNAPASLLTAEVFQLVEDGLPLGLRRIQLSGGEPLMKWHMVADIATYCSERDVATILYTNGYLATDKVVRALAEAGLNKVRISIGGPDYATHSEHRHDPGGPLAWRRILNAIELFQSAGIVVETLTPVTKKSIRYLQETARFVTSLGIKTIFFHNYIPSGIPAQDRGFQLDIKDHQRAVGLILEIRKELTGRATVIPNYGLFEFLSDRWEESDPVYKSPCGRTRIGVFPDGGIGTCCCTSLKLANFRRAGFNLREFWLSNPTLKNIRNPKPPLPCALCKRWEVCLGACPSYSSPDPNKALAPTTCPIVMRFSKFKASSLSALEAVRSALGNKVRECEEPHKCTQILSMHGGLL